MYATYAYLAGATGAQIAADLAALCCGAAPAALSAGCNKAATVVAGAAASWSVVDAASYGVVSRKCKDGTTDKYFRFTASGLAINVAALESWNSVSHAAVNATTAKILTTAVAGGGVIFLVATDDLIFGYSLQSTTESVLAWECSRDAPFMAAPRPCWGVLGNTSYSDAKMPRVKTMGSAGDTLDAAVYLGVGNAAGTGATAGRDANEVPYLPMYQLSAYLAGGYIIGAVQSAYRVADNAYATGDTLNDSGGAVFVYCKGGGTSYAVKRL